MKLISSLMLFLAIFVAPLRSDAAHPFLCCDHNGGKVCVVSAEGAIEWEYACKANAPEPAELGAVAVFKSNSKGQYNLVGTKKPNAFGLFDMLGNVMEWTTDQYYADAYKDPKAWYPSKTSYPHTARGGSWGDVAERVRCAARFPSDASWKLQDPNLPKSIWYHTDALGLGFRLIRPLKIPTAEEMHAYWNNGVAEDQ